MKNGSLSSYKIIIGFLVLLGASWLLDKAVFKPIQHVLLCEANMANCHIARAEFIYDKMDGQFVIKKLYRSDATITFSPVDCWVKGEGSVCRNSLTNQNMTGIESIIVPLAYELRGWRWQGE